MKIDLTDLYTLHLTEGLEAYVSEHGEAICHKDPHPLLYALDEEDKALFSIRLDVESDYITAKFIVMNSLGECLASFDTFEDAHAFFTLEIRQLFADASAL